MLKKLRGGKVYNNRRWIKMDVMLAASKILGFENVTNVTEDSNVSKKIQVLDCENAFVVPGFIDSQACLVGGSGEEGFLSQPPRITVEECIAGGITTTIGCIGVDTMTRTMSNLFAAVRAFKEAGMSAYAYSGGYEIPPSTLTGNLRSDIFYVDEIIGAGEISIADRRAPEPSDDALARVVIDAYTAGLMTKKAGVTRIHVGGGKRRLATLREMMSMHEIIPESLYITHLDRSNRLMDEGISMAKKGCFVDFDIREKKLSKSYLRYVAKKGPKHRLSFSSDAGVCSPTLLWQEIRKCVVEHKIPLEHLLGHVTQVPAKALKLPHKGKLGVGMDADIVVIDQKTYEIRHVIANGILFFEDYKFLNLEQPFKVDRKADWYGYKI